ncbi:MAG: 50S ribosomal protein L4 [Longimicrobiales bacterium]
MAKAPVFSTDGGQTGERDLPEALFDGVVHQTAMWQAVKAMLANQRRGSASTKTRSQVSGGGSKPWRQKGTGRARQGSIRAPQWRGGGNVFGPHGDRNFTQRLPKKVKWLARRSAYNARAEDGSVRLVQGIDLDVPRAKAILSLIDVVDADGNVLILTDGVKQSVYLSARNLIDIEVRPFGEESVYDLLWADTLIIEEGALERAADVAHA